MTLVIHVRDRVRYERAGSRVVYVGRPGHGEDGYFGNPVVPGRLCPVCHKVHDLHTDREGILECFRDYAVARMGRDPEYAMRIKDLKGAMLACFCAPSSCHGDVLAELAEAAGD